jgi:MerR family transcriptional regulator, light-induced transcriptional regulator
MILITMLKNSNDICFLLDKSYIFAYMKMYNINSVSKITGLTAFVIRAWEKRYSVVTPRRTDTNRRLYSEEDIEKLKLLKEAVDRGNSISTVAGLAVDDLKSMLVPTGNGDSSFNSDPNAPEIFFNRCMDAIRELSYRNLERSLIRASIDLSHPVLIEKVVLPLLREIGVCWQQGTLRVAQEHMASAVIRTFLYNLRDSYKPSEYDSRIIITTPYGQHHEFGALISALIAASEGWDALYLGPDLPASEIIAASEQLKPKVVALSIVLATDDETLNKEIEKLKYLPEGVKLIAGGKGSTFFRSALEKANGTLLEDFNALRNFLRKT